MTKTYLIKKGSILLLSLFFITTLTFFLMHSIPGDPFIQDKAIPEEILKSLHRHYGLDQPLPVQYVKYLKGALTGNLGPSFKYEGRTVTQIIMDGFPISLTLGLEALCIALSLGISEHTVKFHISGIYSKLGATNRTEAVRLGVRRGLVVL